MSKKKELQNFLHRRQQHVLIHLVSDENSIHIRTYQREIGKKGRFFLYRNALREWLDGDRKRPFYDMDCGNVLCILSDGEILDFRVYWLSHAYGVLSGYEQFFSIPADMMKIALNTPSAIRHLYVPPCDAARIELHVSREFLRKIITDSRKKHALSKAMRDCFQWRNEIVRLYDDRIADFFFRTESGFPSCGGLILHESTINTVRGIFPKYIYSVHT